MKIKVMILLLALSLFCAGAEAMNYKPYECFYEMDGPSLLYGEHDTFSCSWGNANGDIRLPWHLFWRKDGQVYRDYAYNPQQEDFGSGTVFLPIDEETCHVLQNVWEDPEKWGSWYGMLYDWTENGMEFLCRLPVADTVYQQMDGQIVASKDGKLMRYGLDGSFIGGEPIPEDMQIDHDGLARIRSAPRDGMKTDEVLYRSGNLYWTERMDAAYHFTESGAVYRFGMGRPNKYDPLDISLLNADGTVAQKGKLTGNKVILGVQKLRWDEESGSVQIYGHAVANSRKVYRVYRMTLDAQMKLLDMDVRGCSYHGNYSPIIYLTDGGTAYVGLHAMDGSNAKSVYVPFDALDRVNNPEMQWKTEAM